MAAIEIKQPSKPINKLAENHEYTIKKYYEVNTKFGPSYILIDNKDNKYWGNKSINEFLTTKPQPFKLKTYIYNEFTNEYGEDVKYLTLSWKPLTVKERKALKLLVDKQKQMKKEIDDLDVDNQRKLDEFEN